MRLSRLRPMLIQPMSISERRSRRLFLPLVLLVWLALLPALGLAQTESDRRMLSAAQRGDLRYYRAALAGGARAIARDSGGNGALALAAYGRNFLIVQDLVERGADPNGRGSLGFTALTISALRGDAHIVRLLLKAGARVEEKDALGDTPLLRAVRFRREEVLDLLLAAGAEPDAPDREGMTALMWAAQMADRGLFEKLLAAGADPKRRDRAQRSVLYWAILGGDEIAVARLLERGVDPRRTAPNLSAAEMLERMDRPAISALLRETEGRRLQRGTAAMAAPGPEPTATP